LEQLALACVEEFLKLIGVLKAEVNRVWLGRGVPPPLLEALSAHVVEETLIALRLAKALDCDIGRTLLLTLAHELGDASQSLEMARKEFEEAASLEARVARIAHELAIVAQAKRYLKMGLDVRKVLEEHVSRVLDEAAAVKRDVLAQLVHEALSSSP